jgi:hypothetical protein
MAMTTGSEKRAAEGARPSIESYRHVAGRNELELPQSTYEAGFLKQALIEVGV